MGETRIVRKADLGALARHVAAWLTNIASASSGRFTLALSGGSTPRLLYQVLAEPAFRARFPWERTHLFWGDERLVPHDHEDSNFRMARLALLDRVPCPPANIHKMPVAGTPEEAAAAYQTTMRGYYRAGVLDPARPFFDVTLLGLGEDGHTASLFPGAPALNVQNAWVAPVTKGVRQPRLTLTYPAIASSRIVAFLVAGPQKADVLQRVLAGDRDLPAARVTAAGELVWFVDAAAAGEATA